MVRKGGYKGVISFKYKVRDRVYFRSKRSTLWLEEQVESGVVKMKFER